VLLPDGWLKNSLPIVVKSVIMKSKYIILLMFFMAGQAAMVCHAQKDKDESRIERLKSQKVAFLTERIGLTSAEGQEFWPVYNEFSAKMDSIWDKKKKNIHKLHRSLESLTKAEKEQAIDRHIRFGVQKAQLEKAYHEKFKKILGIEKIIKLYEAEYDFKKKLLNLIRGDKDRSSSHNDCDNSKDENV
jgi:uncharacterized protein YjfI (DUF2170 family)